MYYECFGNIYDVCTTCMLDAHESQKRALDSLELKLQMIVTPHVGAGN